MKKSIFFLFSTFYLLLIINLQAQNLIPNYSFENHNTCGPYIISPYLIGYDTTVTLWFSPTLGSPDYFDTCGPNDYGVPQNPFGFQFARTGYGYVDIDVFSLNPVNYREYVEVKLTDSLIEGKKYCASYFVSLSDSSNYAIENMGLYFSDNLIKDSSIYHLPYIPQIKNPLDSFLTDKKNWKLISGEYIAHGGEKYITIGNFYDDNNTDTIHVSGGSHYLQQEAIYYIDDVWVSLCSDTLGINEINENNNISVYPNPANDNITIETPPLSIIEILDIEGQLIKTCKASGNKTYIDVLNFPSGVYVVEVKTEKGVEVKKFVKE